MSKTQSSKKLQPRMEGLTIHHINIAIKTSETCQAILNHFTKEVFKTAGAVGSGAAKYEGNWDETESIFVGGNSKESYLLRFVGDEGLRRFGLFRGDFLNVASNAGHVANLSLSSLQATWALPSPFGEIDSEALSKMFEATVQMQQKTQPKVSIESYELLVGGKTSTTCLRCSSLPAVVPNVRTIGISLKIKDNPKLFATVKTNVSSAFRDIIANEMYVQLGRITVSPFVEEIRTRLAKNFNIGQVITSTQVKARALSKSSQYAKRSLVGVANRLMVVDTCNETLDLIVDWIHDLKSRHTSMPSRGAEMISLMRDVLEGTYQSKGFFAESAGKKRSSVSPPPRGNTPANFSFLSK